MLQISTSVDIVVNIRVNVQEMKTHFSRYLDSVEKGDVVVVCRHNKPVAELRAIPNPDSGAVPIKCATIDEDARSSINPRRPSIWIALCFAEPAPGYGCTSAV